MSSVRCYCLVIGALTIWRPPPNAFRHDPADPSATALKESWESKLARMRSVSPYGALAGWRLLGCIVKVGDDLRQEMLAAQLLRRLQAVWGVERVPLRLRPYDILCLDRECGLIQPVRYFSDFVGD
ncbi:phosphatidylinositol 4-kinase beta-like [Manduca sexta]|uniref:phosphatidylinositol 4-kinase beta-like n=1 Tax=Manduca sexta TaxID=7130 RepID=UPI001890A7EB|nr:phosphatidylinositol 4-kinase beta-like [Manduca sexta]